MRFISSCVLLELGSMVHTFGIAWDPVEGMTTDPNNQGREGVALT